MRSEPPLAGTGWVRAPGDRAMLTYPLPAGG